MVAVLRRILNGGAARPAQARPLTMEVGDQARPHRVIICDDDALRTESAPTLVGFFAQKRFGLDHARLTEVDDQLVAEFPRHPGILSYSSIALSDGDWGNLVILRSSSDGQRWREGDRHAWAARDLAPAHYRSVRLHNGWLPGGLLSEADPVLLRTRYWDYEAGWRAERVLENDAGHDGAPSDRIEAVDPEVARALRAMSGMERLRLAHETWEVTRARLAAYLMFRFPEWSLAQIEREIARRLLGDAGRAAPIRG